MGSAASHELYVPPDRAPLDPAVRARLRVTGPVFDHGSKVLPLWALRKVYDAGGLLDKPTLRCEIVEEDAAIPSADPALHQMTCRVYAPRLLHMRGDTSPLLFYIHGGGYSLGGLASHQSTCRFLAAETGFRVLAVNYRLAPEAPYPAADNDCVAAYKHVCAFPTVFHLDAANPKIIISGDSAGGQLTLALGLRIREHNRALSRAPALGEGGAGAMPRPPPLAQPAQLVPFYPVINRYKPLAPSNHKYGSGYELTAYMADCFAAYYLGATKEARAVHEADPFLNPDLQTDMSGLPPTLLVTAECDILHDEGVAMAAHMAAAGGECTHLEAHGLLHGFVTHLAPYPAAAAVVRDVAARMVKAAGGAGAGTSSTTTAGAVPT